MKYRLVGIGNMTVDRIVKDGKILSYMPGGVTNLCRTWVEFVDPSAITPVTKIGDDKYVKHVKRELGKLGIDKSYILEIPNAESRLYEINVTDPQSPKIQKKQDAEILMNTPPKDITPILPNTAFVFYQSFATLFETPYLDLTLKTIKEANRLGVKIVVDNNIRQKSVEKVKIMSDTIKHVFNRVDFLKLNEGEAKILLNPEINQAIEKIRLDEEDLSKVADEITKDYGVKNIAITMGERGSFIQTPDKKLRFDAVKPINFINSLGAGDLYSAGICMKYVRNLSYEETGTLATVLGALATEGVPAYPKHLTRKKIINAIKMNANEFYEKYKINVDEFLRNLKFN